MVRRSRPLCSSIKRMRPSFRAAGGPASAEGPEPSPRTEPVATARIVETYGWWSAALMAVGRGSGEDRARIAAEQAVACPLLEGIDLSGAKGVLVLITAAKGSLKLSESKLAMNTIRAYASPDAHVIYGTAYDDGLVDEIRVTVVATGLSRQGIRRTAPPLQVLRTGTDNVPFQVPTMTSVVGQPVNVAAAASAGVAQPDYHSMATPSVWRTRDRTQAAAKVDALASGGMDDYEIPAFLRKQAD